MSWQIEREDYYDIAIFDILGRKVKTIRTALMPAGFYSEHAGEGLASGVYLAIISRRESRRMIKFTVLH